MGRARLNGSLMLGGRPEKAENKLIVSGTHMSQSETLTNFSGPYKGLLAELSALIDWVRANHDLSYVKAGDNAVYSYGGNGYVVVFDETLWRGLVELQAPDCTFAIKPGEDGKVEVTSSNADEKVSKQRFKEAVEAIRDYYETRYWSTPKTATS
ncbi:MAG: hypothetical protein ACJ74J_22685 [Blastocatellia bacterium]